MHPKPPYGADSAPPTPISPVVSALNERIERKHRAFKLAENHLANMKYEVAKAQIAVDDLKQELEELRAKREQL